MNVKYGNKSLPCLFVSVEYGHFTQVEPKEIENSTIGIKQATFHLVLVNFYLLVTMRETTTSIVCI